MPDNTNELTIENSAVMLIEPQIAPVRPSVTSPWRR